jgi:hypothetical protein
MSKAKAAKKKNSPPESRVVPQMRIVLSDTCAVCKTPCTRGLAYLARMNEPGAVGNGVPCVLTLPQAKPSSAS